MKNSIVSVYQTEFAPAERASTDVVLRQHQLWGDQEQVKLICSAVPSLILILNEFRQMVYSNSHFQGLGIETSIDDLLGQRPGEIFGCVHAFETEGGCGTTSFCKDCGAANAILKGLSGINGVEECTITNKDSYQEIDLRVWTTPVVLNNERFTIFTISDISLERENRKLFEEVQKAAVLDPLTGIFNRRAFFETAGREITRSIRYHNPFSILMIDLDEFKSVNDTYGHPVGDALLVEMVHRIKLQLRDVDVLARYGGDEFGLVGGLKTKERIQQSVESAPFEINGHIIRSGISCGLTEYQFEQDKDIDAIILRADQELYLNKIQRKQIKHSH